jgi:hypothetical protein
MPWWNETRWSETVVTPVVRFALLTLHGFPTGRQRFGLLYKVLLD